MNNNEFYKNPMFPGNPVPYENQNIRPIRSEGLKPLNINTMLLENKGRHALVYMSYPNAVEWRNQKYEGKISEIGLDYLTLFHNKKWFVLPIKYIDYIEFNEPLNYKSVY